MSAPSSVKWNATQWLILVVAAIGFLFDTYELLMFPIIGRPALAELHRLPADHPTIREWIGNLLWIAAICGGIFGLLGGYLIDRLGRKRVMVASILLYSFSPVGAALSTDPWWFAFFRCTTFIGVCVEFVAAITWLAELFPNQRERELAIGWTQAFASLGGILVSAAFAFITANAASFPALPVPEPFAAQAAWRYTLISGLIPGILILLLLPFVPESRIWQEKKKAGTLKRPSFGELFSGSLLRTTLVTTALSACAYAAAFGALQVTPALIVPGLPAYADTQKQLIPLRKELTELNQKLAEQKPGTDEHKAILKQIADNRAKQKPLTAEIEKGGNNAQFWQEIGGLIGRILLAILVVYIANRSMLLRLFQLPGLILFPLVYYYLFRENADWFVWGVLLCGLVTVAQFSYFGEYLPKVFPLHLRGTGGSFATNIGGRMIGTSAAMLTTNILSPWLAGGGTVKPIDVATAAAIVGGSVYLIGLVLSFFLPKTSQVAE